jgi:deoxyribonuclease (pyrimidine dimer)
MVRVNIIDPKALADQHLIAEYDEILMLFGYVKRYPVVKEGSIPKKYTLNKGHMLFFKDKLLYLKKRHESLKVEMRARGFATNMTVNLKEYPKLLCNDWTPSEPDKKIIRERIMQKLELKPEYYNYRREKRPLKFFMDLIRKAK